MEIKKYKAKVLDSDMVVIGYIAETRMYLGNGSYGDGTSYVMSVTSKSMPDSETRGTFLVDVTTIEEAVFCPVCNKNEVIKEYKNCACSDKCYNEL